jgi:riboflavin synthase
LFTGIIEETGQLKSLNGGRIEITCEKILSDMKIGDSICTNGICLTVTNFSENYFAADVMPETLRRTSLEELNIGGAVNLERAMKIGDRFGGHIVSGHIDGVGKISNIRTDGNAVFINISAESFLLKQIAAKGSVALDGISLTVVDAGINDFSVSMIPHTRAVTNFKFKRVGSLVNVETDILAKYIERLINYRSTGVTGDLTKEFLIANGF